MTATATPFRQRLDRLTTARGALCVGIDPHPPLLAQWRLTDDVEGLERFARGLIEAIGDKVAVFKPQVAFFESYGAAGVAVLERVLADVRDAGALAIADAKRGDIGSTMAGYARAWLSDESPLHADAVTLSPFLGVESLRPALDLAAATGRGVYVLCRTSNPEGHALQLSSDGDGRTVSQRVIDETQAENARTGLDHVGLVIGATHADLGCDPSAVTGSILAPGIGAQGGTMAGVRAAFGPALARVLPSVSRDVLSAGPDAAALAERVERLLAA
ncbi:MAG TPA: orotidine-5'-phosphate decarboxylase [Propionibacteriaceae bacterium]|nr:orotidine-5'-phosphate decarboxylase [Propionibacteriaceae bacterium]